jgi:hypothetical protein
MQRCRALWFICRVSFVNLVPRAWGRDWSFVWLYMTHAQRHLLHLRNANVILFPLNLFTDHELSIPKTPFSKATFNTPTSAFTPGSSSKDRHSRPFHKTPVGFTNTVPRITRKSSFVATSISSSRRIRKLKARAPQTRELTQEEKEMLSGGVNRLDNLLDDDLFWSS